MPKRGFIVNINDGQLDVLIEGTGQRLDATAAQVLLALGGDAPDWLPIVEGLNATWAYNPLVETLRTAAEELDSSLDQQAQSASTTHNPAVLVALAGAGVAEVAGNPHCPASAWDLLRLYPEQTIQDHALYLGRVLPPTLINHQDGDTRARAARNPRCDPSQLAALADDHDKGVLLAVAGNPSTAPKTLAKLTHRPDAAIRATVAANHSFPIRSLRTEALLNDRQGAALAAFASRTDASGYFLHRVEEIARSKRGQYRTVLLTLQRNPSTPKRLRRRVEQRLTGTQGRQISKLTHGTITSGRGALIALYLLAISLGALHSGSTGLAIAAIGVLACRLARNAYRRQQRSSRPKARP